MQQKLENTIYCLNQNCTLPKITDANKIIIKHAN